MYLGIDIGGTKTLVAVLNNEGVIIKRRKFPTPRAYQKFLDNLASTVAEISAQKFIAAGVAAPGRLDRKHDRVLAFGNLPWKDVPLGRDIKKIVKCPVAVENDANLAGLSEALLIKEYDTVLYITVSTGIGTGIISHQKIDPRYADSEGGHILLEHKGELQKWEEFASGKAIVKKFGKRASDITDKKTWRIIAHNIAVGLYDLVAFMQPDAVVMGGGVGTHFDEFDDYLLKELKIFETPLTPIPPIFNAQRPEEAVVYGCYELAKETYGKSPTTD